MIFFFYSSQDHLELELELFEFDDIGDDELKKRLRQDDEN